MYLWPWHNSLSRNLLIIDGNAFESWWCNNSPAALVGMLRWFAAAAIAATRPQWGKTTLTGSVGGFFSVNAESFASTVTPLIKDRYEKIKLLPFYWVFDLDAEKIHLTIQRFMISCLFSIDAGSSKVEKCLKVQRNNTELNYCIIRLGEEAAGCLQESTAFSSDIYRLFSPTLSSHLPTHPLPLPLAVAHTQTQHFSLPFCW